MLTDHIDNIDVVIALTIPVNKTPFLVKKTSSLRMIKNTNDCEHKALYYTKVLLKLQPVGRNTFTNIRATIAKYLNLKDKDQYTGK